MNIHPALISHYYLVNANLIYLTGGTKVKSCEEFLTRDPRRHSETPEDDTYREKYKAGDTRWQFSSDHSS